MIFNRFDYIGLPEGDAYSLATYNGFRFIVVKRLLDDSTYKASFISQVFVENRITLLSDDKLNITDCYIG